MVHVLLIPDNPNNAIEVHDVRDMASDIATLAFGEGRWIEDVALGRNLSLLVDEEGAYTVLYQPNERAMALHYKYRGFERFIVGPAVVMQFDSEGDGVDLNTDTVMEIVTTLAK